MTELTELTEDGNTSTSQVQGSIPPSKTDVMVSTGLALGIGTHAGMVEALDDLSKACGYASCFGLMMLIQQHRNESMIFCWLFAFQFTYELLEDEEKNWLLNKHQHGYPPKLEPPNL